MLKRKLVKEFLASAGLACCLLGVSLTGEARAATAYTDVQTSDWYYQAVTELSAEHILLGATGNTFSPGKAVSREDFATALWMLVTGGDTVVPEAVSDWVVQTGLFAVDTDLSVGLTRQEAAQCLSALIRNTGMTIPATLNIPPAFADQEKISKDAEAAVQLMQTTQLLQGYPDGTFRPDGTLTRAEAAVILQKLSPYCDNLPLIISLPGNATTGYTWQVDTYDEAVVSVVELPYIDLGESQMVGAPGLFRFAIYGLSEGRAALDFYYARSGEGKQEPTNESHITVSVDKDGQVVQLSR